MKKSSLILACAAALAAASMLLIQLPAYSAAPGAAAGGFPGGGGRAGAGAGRGAGAAGRGPGRGAPPGPPAPVPPEVAIPRPTPAELTQINAELKRLVDADTSADKALLQKYQSLITVQMPRANSAIAPVQTGVRTTAKHQLFVAAAQKGDIDLLLEGDSITDWWINIAAGGQQEQDRKPTQAYTKYFGNIKTADFAVAGDTTQGVLWGLQNGEGQGPNFHPKAIMLMIGTNNLGANTPEEIAEGIGAIVLENRKDFPNAKILLLAVFPRGNPNDANRPRIAQINQIISKLDDKQHVFYMDIGPKFLDPNTGAFLPDSFRADLLHPQEKGYDIWGAAVIDTLNSWLK